MYRKLVICLTLCLLLTGQTKLTTADDSGRKTFTDALDAATDAVGSDEFDDKITALLKLFPQTDDQLFVVDGDQLFTGEQIRTMILERRMARDGKKPWPSSATDGELIINTEGGVPTCYRSADSRKLTYAIDRASFDSAPENNAYENVRAEVARAFGDWEAVCPECEIDFVELDNTSPQVGDAFFIVRYVGPQRYIAAAFFPNDPIARRYLNVGYKHFTESPSRVGVLRHEAGHILGYRHEHIRPEAPIQCHVPNLLEPSNWEPLGDFDLRSVMHYLCGHGGSASLEITEDDKEKHRRAYLEVCVE